MTKRVTINIPRRVVYVAGNAHELSRAGVNKLFLWLMDNGALLWGWDCGEYVFQVDQVGYAAD
jgi:hypothetical protein